MPSTRTLDIKQSHIRGRRLTNILNWFLIKAIMNLLKTSNNIIRNNIICNNIKSNNAIIILIGSNKIENNKPAQDLVFHIFSSRMIIASRCDRSPTSRKIFMSLDRSMNTD